MKLNNFLLRGITGLLFVTAIVGSILLGPVGYLVVFGFFAVAGLLEFYKLTRAGGYQPQQWAGLGMGVGLFATNFLHAAGYVAFSLYLFIIPAVVLVFILELYRKKTNPFGNIALTLLGIIYVIIPFSLFSYLIYPRTGEGYEWRLVFGFFILLWTSDTGAYITGMLWGKHRLFERVSPKKSWEGFAGGVFFTLLVAYLLGAVLGWLERDQWMVTGAIIAVAGVFGDLIESLYKRSLDIKDSGNLLPGHGGVLDRFDSVLIALPMVYFYFAITHIIL